VLDESQLDLERSPAQVQDPRNQLILKQPLELDELIVDTPRSDADEWEEIKEASGQRHHRQRSDDSCADLMHNEYVIDPKTQSRMNAFYNDRVSEQGRTFDNGGSQYD